MAFECQQDTKNCVTESLADFSNSFANVQVDCNPVDTSAKGKAVRFDSGKSSPRSNFNANLGILKTKNQTLVHGTARVPPEVLLSITDLPEALISEVLNCLDPKELGIVSCVSSFLYRLASEKQLWKKLYCERWGTPVAPALGLEDSDEKSWKDSFVEKEFRSKTFLGRYTIDTLYGHTDAVKAVFVLASKKLIFTSGYDQTVRMWNMEDGTFIASSRSLGCTIRAVAADSELLIAGGTDGFIHGWKAEDGSRHVFDLKAQNQNLEFRIWDHEGPITCLSVDFSRIYSGSWDMTVRIWDRANLKCLKVLMHSDWVWSLVPHDNSLVSSAGSDVYLWDTTSGTQLAAIDDAHVGNVYSLARSHTGKILFTGGEDGVINMYEISSNDSSMIRMISKWMPHTGPVYALTFEFPWLFSASSDGTLALINVRKLMRPSRDFSARKPSKVEITVKPPQRMLHGFGCNLFSLDVGPDRIVCGGEEGVVRIWNFTGALEAEQRACTLRGIRLENRMRRQKIQNVMNEKTGRSDAVKKNPTTTADRNSWHNKRKSSGKVNS